MKNLFIGLIFLFCLSAQGAHQTYLDAVEMTYVHTGSGDYDVYLKFHRRCYNANTNWVIITAKSSSLTLADTALLVSKRDVTIASIGCYPSNTDTLCNTESLDDRVEELIYRASFSLGSYTNHMERYPGIDRFRVLPANPGGQHFILSGIRSATGILSLECGS